MLQVDMVVEVMVVQIRMVKIVMMEIGMVIVMMVEVGMVMVGMIEEVMVKIRMVEVVMMIGSLIKVMVRIREIHAPAKGAGMMMALVAAPMFHDMPNLVHGDFQAMARTGIVNTRQHVSHIAVDFGQFAGPHRGGLACWGRTQPEEAGQHQGGQRAPSTGRRHDDLLFANERKAIDGL